MKTIICSCIIVLLSMHFLFAQRGDEDIFTDRAKSTLTCAWTSSQLYDGPGKKYRPKAKVTFGEVVERMGQKAYVGSEKKKYIKVKTAQGKQGWIHDFHFVSNGVAAIVQNKSPVYLEPRNRNAITREYFAAGEEVIRSAVSGDWIELYSRDKRKRGWIRGRNRISFDKEQFESKLAGQRTGSRNYYASSNSSASSSSSSKSYPSMPSRGSRDFYPNSSGYSNISQNRNRGEVVGHMRSFLSMQDKQSKSSYGASSSSSASSDGYSQANYRPLKNSSSRPTLKHKRNFSSDTEGGKRKFESGKIYRVNLPMEGNSTFVGYHKSLPAGSRVQVPFPDNEGFVEIEIVGSMRENMKEVIGLSPKCLSIIFGDNIPDKINFSYVVK